MTISSKKARGNQHYQSFLIHVKRARIITCDIKVWAEYQVSNIVEKFNMETNRYLQLNQCKVTREINE